MNRPLQHLLESETLCPATMSMPRRVHLCGRDLGSGAWALSWNDSGTVGSSLTSSRNHGLGCQCLPDPVPGPLLVGLGGPGFGG